MAKKPSKKTLKAKADKLAGAACRARGYCQAKGLDSVGCGGPLQWAHIQGRRHLALRWAPENCLCLCAGHHLWYSDQPIVWTRLIENHFPAQADWVERHRNDIFDGDYDSVLERLKEQP